jgi:diguanylate cyclase (GGDEF)-like protein
MALLFRLVLILSVALSSTAVIEMLLALPSIRSKTQWNALFFPSGAFLVMATTIMATMWPNRAPTSSDYLLSGITLLLSAGAVGGVTSLIRLMSAQQRRDDENEFLRMRYERLFKANDLPIVVSEAESLKIVDANAAAESIFEVPVGSLLQMTVLDLGIEDAPGETTVPANIKDRMAPGLVHRAPSGAVSEIVIHRSVVGVGQTHLHYDIIEDVTERNAARRELLAQKDLMANLADHDALTQLPNRRILEPALELAVARARRGSPGVLMFIDVDDFKSINDVQGHQAGDAALAAIAELLCGAVRAGDIVARVGGDEFAILLETTGLAEASAVATRLTQSIREVSPRLGLSIGLTSTARASSGSDAIRRADRCMYEAKSGGKNRIVVDDGGS